MHSFYEKKGPDSWIDAIVPHFITCNSFIGRSYAKTLLGYLRDCIRNSNSGIKSSEPFYIIELGAGCGKFSFYMLKALDEMQEISDFPFTNIVYVMTDFTEKNLEYWVNHPSLKPYFESGRLDVAIFNAVADHEIRLKSGKVLRPNSVVNPICIVANYVFDTLHHDLFQVDENNELLEGLISTGNSF